MIESTPTETKVGLQFLLTLRHTHRFDFQLKSSLLVHAIFFHVAATFPLCFLANYRHALTPFVLSNGFACYTLIRMNNALLLHFMNSTAPAKLLLACKCLC